MKPYLGRMSKCIFCSKILGFSQCSVGRNAAKEVEVDIKGGGDAVK